MAVLVNGLPFYTLPRTLPCTLDFYLIIELPSEKL